MSKRYQGRYTFSLRWCTASLPYHTTFSLRSLCERGEMGPVYAFLPRYSTQERHPLSCIMIRVERQTGGPTLGIDSSRVSPQRRQLLRPAPAVCQPAGQPVWFRLSGTDRRDTKAACSIVAARPRIIRVVTVVSTSPLSCLR